MELRQLEYFVAVCEELNFTRAARRCHVVQSALSQQISRLEREVGVPLFERTSRSVRVAAGGEVLLPHARTVLAAVRTAGEELAALSGVLTGTLRLGLVNVTSLSAPVVDQVLKDYRRRYDGIEIRIVDLGTWPMLQGVREGSLDAAVVGAPADAIEEDLAPQALSTHPLVAVLPSGHPLEAREDVALADLAACGPLVEMREAAGLRRSVDAAFATAGIERTVAFEVATTDELIHYASLGLGSALTPASTAESHNLRDDVVVRPLRDVEILHTLTFVHRRRPAPSPAAQAFVAMMDHYTAQPGRP